MTAKKGSKSGAATRSGTKAASEQAARASASSAESGAPRTGTPTGAGPDVGGTGTLTGQPPAIREERHGGAALTGTPPAGATPAAGAGTGPVVQNTAGGLEFERQRSGTRAQQTKEQPTTPERAEIVEARRLEQEIQKARINPAAGASRGMKVGDRIRVLRNAASGWEMGTVKYADESGSAASAELDGGEVVGLEPGRFEPAVGALAAPTIDDRDLVEQGGTIDRSTAEADASGASARSAQTSANPSRARAKSTK